MIRTVRAAGLNVCVEDAGGILPPILLCHGGSCSRRAFTHQFRGLLAEQFRIIALDLPGHGDSERAAEPDTTYTLAGYAGAVVEVVRALEIDTAILVGWSLGAHVLFHASTRLPDSRGLVAVGAAPVGKPPAFDRMYARDPALGVAYRAHSTEDETRALVARFFRPGFAIPEFAYEDFRRTDPRTRTVLASSIARLEFEDEFALLESSPAPVAFICGEHEQIVDLRYFSEVPEAKSWRGSLHVVAHAGHAPHFEAPEDFDALLSSFASKSSRRS
jgi:pimeloyl-ACP methyl ester carboxylesterase